MRGADLDVTKIDPGSIRLKREGIAGAVAPFSVGVIRMLAVHLQGNCAIAINLKGMVIVTWYSVLIYSRL